VAKLSLPISIDPFQPGILPGWVPLRHSTGLVQRSWDDAVAALTVSKIPYIDYLLKRTGHKCVETGQIGQIEVLLPHTTHQVSFLNVKYYISDDASCASTRPPAKRGSIRVRNLSQLGQLKLRPRAIQTRKASVSGIKLLSF
jgi:hypothetical protein